MKFLNLLPVLLLFVTINLSAQNESYDSRAWFEKAKQHLANDHLKDAIKEYSKISVSDSLYPEIVTPLSYCLLGTKQEDKAIEILQFAIQNFEYNENLNFYYNNLIAAYKQLEQYENLIKVVNQALIYFPFDDELYFDLAVGHFGLKDYEQAFAEAEKGIEINPFSTANHIMLGDIYYKNGRMAEALMMYNIALLFGNNLNYLGIANTNCSKDPRNAKPIKVSFQNQALDQINTGMVNLIALSKKYKIPGKLDYPIIKQNHLLYESIKDVSVEEDSRLFKYVEFFKWISQNTDFEIYSLNLLMSSKNEQIIKKINSKKDKIAQARNNAFEKFQKLNPDLVANHNGKQTAFKRALDLVDGEYKLLAFGETLTPSALQDYWYILNNGAIYEKGSFDSNGKRTGYWESFDHTGFLNSTGSYKNGEYDNTYVIRNAIKDTTLLITYEEGKANGLLKYYEDGALSESKYLKNGELNGPLKSYYLNTPEILYYEGNFKDGLADGHFKYYYKNGKLRKEAHYSNNIQVKTEKIYHLNGQLEAEIPVVEGEIEGLVYYMNEVGDTTEYGSFKEGQRNGEWIRLYPDGSIAERTNWSNGSYDGAVTNYNHRGNITSIYEYKKGYVRSYKDFNEKGELIVEKERDGKTFNYEGYNQQGIKTIEGLYNIKGGKEGTWTYYYLNGQVSNIEHFKDGKVDGKQTAYYKNGQISSEENYVDGNIDGLAKYYHFNGQVQSIKNFQNGIIHGPLLNYYANGQLKDSLFYDNGKLNGEAYSFTIEGDTESQYRFHKDIMIYSIVNNDKGERSDTLFYNRDNTLKTYTHYNAAGKKTSDLKRINAQLNGEATYYYPNGKVSSQTSYLSGDRNGAYLYYNPEGNKVISANHILGDYWDKYEYYHPNGVLSYTVNYIRGERHGHAIGYDFSGKLESDYQYYIGKKHGECLSYDSEENLILKRVYWLDKLIEYSYLKKDGTYSAFIPVENDELKFEYKDQNDVLRLKFHYKNGKNINQYIEYYQDGKPREIINYEYDKRNGLYQYFYPNGQIYRELNYLNGDIHGKEKYFHKNGQMKSEANYIHDVLTGEKNIYDTSGKLIRTENYLNNSLITIEYP